MMQFALGVFHTEYWKAEPTRAFSIQDNRSVWWLDCTLRSVMGDLFGNPFVITAAFIVPFHAREISKLICN